MFQGWGKRAVLISFEKEFKRAQSLCRFNDEAQAIRKRKSTFGVNRLLGVMNKNPFFKKGCLTKREDVLILRVDYD